METLKRVLVFVSALFVATCLICQVVIAEGDVGKGRGRITEINTAANYLAVDVPIGPDELMTVAGSISPKAELKKGPTDCTLGEFKVEDQVTVSWRRTESGLTIESLRGAAFPASDFSSGSGRITEINPPVRYLAVDVPLGNNEFMTVAGGLGPKAVLKKGGKMVGLSEFKVNDQVSVTWRRRDEGLVIEAVSGN